MFFQYRVLTGAILVLSSFFISRTCTAQLCNGSLGDPVVNITFGNVSNPGSSAYAPPNTYVYASSSCPNDGFYTITRNSSNCFSNTWHNVTADHTGDGAFMLVNASFEPGDFFLTTVNGLCPNTTYEFAAWLMNVMIPDGIKPDVTFYIEKPDGTLLNSFSTGSILQTGVPVWKQYGLYFTTPADNPEVVLRITNNAPGGIGNDLALDDITFRPCGPPVTISVQGSSSTIDICEGNSDVFIFDADVSDDYLDPVYQWQSSSDGQTWNDIPGATNETYQTAVGAPGNYRFRITVAEAAANGLKVCRISSNDMLLVVHPKPVVNAGPDRVLISGQTLTLRGSVEGETPAYNWTPPVFLSATNILNPVASPGADQLYKLTATSSFGCENSDEVLVKVVAGIYIPSAFTPNQDGRNDLWRIPFLDPEWDPVTTVFNRQGMKVYESTSATVAWDGTIKGEPQPPGVYVYLVRLTGTNLVFKGFLTLIR